MSTTAPIPGDLVISWSDKEPVIYGGPDERGMSTLRFSLLQAGPPTIKCDLSEVAPADTAIPVKDSRIVIVKLAKKPVAWVAGPWTLALPGIEHVSYYKTKRDATAAGLRRLAILDHVAARTAEVSS